MELNVIGAPDIEMRQIIKEIRGTLTSKEEEITDEQALEVIEAYVLQDKRLAMRSPGENRRLVQRIFFALRRDLDILQPYIEDNRVSEIMVNGKDHIFIETGGKLEKVDLAFDTVEDLEELIRRLAARVHREINELHPIVDARLEDGSRVNAVYKNIALNGPILTIRKFPQKAIDMKALIKMGSITQEAADFLQKLVKAGYNCFISGGTSSGKTTFLNVLSNFIPEDERVILIEDSAELQIKQIRNLVRMECKQANVQQKGRVTMEDLIKTSLRMRPDRIIVGEVRGREVMDMIQAMNTGHDGSLSTGHGNSISGMLRRLESMFLQAADFPVDAIRSQIAEGIDIIIHLGRLSDGSRKVLEIAEIKGITNGEIETSLLFKYRPSKGLIKSSNRLVHTEKLELRGVPLEH
ncbi:ATPase, T2SS/T4P/T4SS family [Anaerovorax odorimutans]|uniref:ATPase, T2SS/T4P/T4SS family n=1 Tax=Anaerovorax odorimutans TaxID=109327 RepID=A0ABT1RM57_9FIRM|nr:ATPase, T2SS/T4P/T4SS family [Anaerovorax odorimutans]MCQ4636271.1 ATPase, T2SS/T4P/T4SS family [Anaerovorax odorimutans]